MKEKIILTFEELGIRCLACGSGLEGIVRIENADIGISQNHEKGSLDYELADAALYNKSFDAQGKKTAITEIEFDYKHCGIEKFVINNSKLTPYQKNKLFKVLSVENAGAVLGGSGGLFVSLAMIGSVPFLFAHIIALGLPIAAVSTLFSGIFGKQLFKKMKLSIRKEKETITLLTAAMFYYRICDQEGGWE